MGERVIEEESMIASWIETENKPGGRYGGAGSGEEAISVSLVFQKDRQLVFHSLVSKDYLHYLSTTPLTWVIFFI